MDDCGGAFAMGAIGGGIFSFVKGWRNSPAVGFTLLVLVVFGITCDTLGHFKALGTLYN